MCGLSIAGSNNQSRCRITGKSVSVAWVDYEKAYDRAPHEWFMTVLKAINCPSWIQRSAELITHDYTNDLLPMAQRAMRKGRWGCVDCLLLDQTIGLDAKITGKPLSVA